MHGGRIDFREQTSIRDDLIREQAQLGGQLGGRAQGRFNGLGDFPIGELCRV
ncbi:MAG: hypothetical protein BWX86_02909 [Verrucomicrobia bacterium ADurb.Bin122]|nr:MAG: hypothetical protein BWX86_02909 [Verrucomicrobia bacterium ADurb.Bin122]